MAKQTGQDGAYLAEFLLEKGYEVHGIKRRSSLFNTDRIDHLYQDPHEPDRRFILHHGDLTDSTSLIRVIQQGGAAGRDLQPRGPIARGGQLRRAGIHGQLRCAARAATAGGHPDPGKTRFYQARGNWTVTINAHDHGYPAVSRSPGVYDGDR